MELEIKLGDKTLMYHVPQNCDINLVIRDGKVKDTLEQVRKKPSITMFERT